MAFSNLREIVASGLTASNFVGIATFSSGTQDGSNTTFGVAHVPDTANFVFLFQNGTFRTDGGVDYTRTGNSFVFVVPPLASDVIRILYLK